MRWLMHKKLVIFDGISKSDGWIPVKLMVSLCTELFDAPRVELDPKTPFPKIRKILSVFQSRTRNKDKPDALFITARAADIWALYRVPDWKNGYNRIYLWVIDSFHVESIPKSFNRQHFDGIFITSGNDLALYKDQVHNNTQFLGWGADVLGKGSSNADRANDILRIGRQPDGWDDDSVTVKAFAQHGINYHGRPQPASVKRGRGCDDAINACVKSKYLIAQSNLVDNSTYTHPTKEYITGRWTDALASGCIVAGVQPKTDYAYAALLWPEATVEFESADLDYGITRLRKELKNWSPALSKLNYLRSLQRLDWRWRLLDIARELNLNFPKLNSSIAELKIKIEQAEAALNDNYEIDKQ